MINRFATLRPLPQPGSRYSYHSLAALEHSGAGAVSRLPLSLRVMLESQLRGLDGILVTEANVCDLSGWKPQRAAGRPEIPFQPARVLLQDASGLPVLADLAMMRDIAGGLGRDPGIVEPCIPADLVIDHSIHVEHWGSATASEQNLRLDYASNQERYRFFKWAAQAFRRVRVLPSGIGICHQVNLEYLAPGVSRRNDLVFADSVVGTDSHTTMINGLGVLGWGVGGIEAHAALLGQPVCIETPDVIGVNLSGKPAPGVTATDIALGLTERFRRRGVVGKFIEFIGAGVATLHVPDRATIANMAPEYGATIALFPSDLKTLAYLRETGRADADVALTGHYLEAQGLLGIPSVNDIDYSEVIDIDLSEFEPSVAGPRFPRQRTALSETGRSFTSALHAAVENGGYGKAAAGGSRHSVADGDIVVAAITSCTNTSNPRLMLAAGLVAKKAIERGLTVGQRVKASLSPGSRVVGEYLKNTGLQSSLDQLGFHIAGYGCMTCVGNSGGLAQGVEAAVLAEDSIAVAVLSGNRNFEGRVHPTARANYLMSPPLVVAFALAGSIRIDATREPLGHGRDGMPVYLRDIWPADTEIDALLPKAIHASTYRRSYEGAVLGDFHWKAIEVPKGTVYAWDEHSSYVRKAPFLLDFSMEEGAVGDIGGARILAILGDAVTTDNISPPGRITASSVAGRYLAGLGVEQADFNSYMARRGNPDVVVRCAFDHPRLENLMLSGRNGGYTVLQPDGSIANIFDVAMQYRERGVPAVIVAGLEYGTGSARDAAARATRLLGVRAIIARSFERIHRTNLVGMGVLPCQFADAAMSSQSIGLDGSELLDIEGISENLVPRQQGLLKIRRRDGRSERVPIVLRLDTHAEVAYYRAGGIMPYVLRRLLPGENAISQGSV